ncbi:MAG: hypothetical protein PHW77_08070 [Eubacteriales bacterium]|nr:hypothetical protein [Eubacteriales bacterium]
MIKKLNLLDIAIIIFVLALCFGGVIYLIKSATANITTVVITVTVSDDTAQNISLQDNIFLENGDKLGTITAVRTLEDQLRSEKALEITLKSEGGKTILKTGQTISFRTSRVKAEGTVYSIKSNDIDVEG